MQLRKQIYQKNRKFSNVMKVKVAPVKNSLEIVIKEVISQLTCRPFTLALFGKWVKARSKKHSYYSDNKI